MLGAFPMLFSLPCRMICMSCKRAAGQSDDQLSLTSTWSKRCNNAHTPPEREVFDASWPLQGTYTVATRRSQFSLRMAANFRKKPDGQKCCAAG